MRIDWGSVLHNAATLVRSYDTGVTLRQLFYRLVADGTLPNTSTVYKHLSATTAEARRRGAFPDLVDLTRTIHRPLGFKGPEEAMGYLDVVYRRDRTEYMERSIYLGVEKAGLVAQLEAWFGERGLPVLALSGFASESYARQVVHDVRMWRRPAILLYAGDFDPSGEDISRDFVARTGCWDKVIRVALTSEQVTEFSLPKAVGKVADSRAAAFAERHGELVQVELDALPPNVLRSLFESSLARFWEDAAFHQSLRLERLDRITLFGMNER